MADRLVQFKAVVESDGDSQVGKIFNIYGSYVNALAHAATGLSTIWANTPLTGAKGASITQVAKTTGVTIDNNGFISFYIDNGGGECFAICDSGLGKQPIRIPII